jgi:CIC family chloride channel protein
MKESEQSHSGIRGWSLFSDHEDRLLIVLSLLIGVVVGLTVVAFLLVTGRFAARMYPSGSAAWRRVAIPTLGSLISGILLYKYFPNARGSGIPQAKFALFIRDGYIKLRTVFGKFLCCSISLASGIALGREGPSVQIGAGIASVIGRATGLSPARVKALVPVGCSAALAAAFNTPIAAVLFSLEEVLGDMQAPVLGSVVLSSATSWMVLHLFLGDQPLFHVPPYRLVNPLEFGIYAVLGVVGGLASVAFTKLLLGLRVWFRQMPKSTVWLQPTFGGLVTGLMALAVPGVLGVGYDFVDRVLGGESTLRTVVLLAVLKLIATPACYASGNAGGIFGPSLFIGAMIGGAVGMIAHSWLPLLTASPGAYALVGMGALFAGIVRTPLTSVIMIFEMTRDYSIIVPLMIANLISFFISWKFQREPIYEALALQEGVFLPTGESREEMSGTRVSELMEEKAPLLSPDATLEEARAFLVRQHSNAWPMGEGTQVEGVVSRKELEEADSATIRIRDMIAKDHAANGYVYLHPDHPLNYALERMRTTGLDALPVVSRAGIHDLCGVLTLNHILEAYGLAGQH